MFSLIGFKDSLGIWKVGFFSGLGQQPGRIDVKVPIVRMLFPECVFRVYRKFLALCTAGYLRVLCLMNSSCCRLNFEQKPDNETRDLVHDFFPPGITINVFPGGGKHISQKSL